MYLKCCTVLMTVMSVISTEVDSPGSSEDNLRKYYTCYINKYFQKDASSEDLQREIFVDQIVSEAIANKDPFPTDNCVEWICDDRVLWKISSNNSLEILAYYSLEQDFVPSWQPCLEDEAEEFVKRNYTHTRAGLCPK